MTVFISAVITLVISSAATVSITILLFSLSVVDVSERGAGVDATADADKEVLRRGRRFQGHEELVRDHEGLTLQNRPGGRSDHGGRFSVLQRAHGHRRQAGGGRAQRQRKSLAECGQSALAGRRLLSGARLGERR